jgi:hypothetical protein
MPDARNIDQNVHDILADMPLKEKAAIANLNEDMDPISEYFLATGVS